MSLSFSPKTRPSLVLASSRQYGGRPVNSQSDRAVPLLNTVKTIWPLAHRLVPCLPHFLPGNGGEEAQFAQEKPWKSAT